MQLWHEGYNWLTLASGSAPAASSLFTIGTWFLHVAIWRGVRPNAFLESIFPPFFFSNAKAESSSATDPCWEINHKSFVKLLDKNLRDEVCFPVAEGDNKTSMNVYTGYITPDSQFFWSYITSDVQFVQIYQTKATILEYCNIGILQA